MLPRNRLLNREGSSLKYASSAVGEIPYLLSVAGSVEEVNLD
jgi:hypothetical protein